ADYFDRLAIDRALDSIGDAERRLAAEMARNGATGAAAIDIWAAARKGKVERIRAQVFEIADTGLTLSKLSVVASLPGALVAPQGPCYPRFRRPSNAPSLAIMWGARSAISSSSSAALS